ncbi:zinc finger protein 638-like isoform X2 [Nerophis ophidion]|uniref:zinc finger protein 638-like isoform X2 n=1 Tax=Nerophis ophidion TaxID=159077 RepID=UPI002AE043D5|nr:zinc finger protein 638-like isoform X2 [Nerophis ophidion]
MSHNQRHRPPPSHADFQPSLRSLSFSERRRPSADHDFPGMLSSSYSYYSSLPPRSSPLDSTDILNSCGLEATDLSLLAQFPEDALTVESLPHILDKIKSNRRMPPLNSLSHLPGSAMQATNQRDRQEHWGNPMGYGLVSQNHSTRRDHLQHSFPSAYDVDDRVPFSGRDAQLARPEKLIPSLFSVPGPANRLLTQPMERQRRTGTGWEQGRSDASSSKIYRQPTGGALPCKKVAMDFHGTTPPMYPYSCSLCNVTVLSEKFWTKHINSSNHAERQHILLQSFPTWDCRMEPVTRSGRQEKKRKDSSNLRPANHVEEKAAKRSNVVCVKFSPQTVDEVYLRKLVEPFGKITKILVFASLAFMEMGSAYQAQELVNFHNQSPKKNGKQMEFSISHSFNFVKSSRVLHFTPSLEGDKDRSNLLSVVKRFGQPTYTLFLPTDAFIEMNSLRDAQKVVENYSSNILRVNDNILKVSFSAEYSSLLKVSSAQQYKEESTKRTRSRHDDSPSKKRKRDEDRSKSRESEDSSTSRERKARSMSREKKARSMSRERNARSKSRERKARSKSRERKARSKSRERKARSKSRERKARSKSVERKAKFQEKKTKEEKPDTESSSASAAALLKSSEDVCDDKVHHVYEEESFSGEDSDLEGMEVIGEDGDALEEDDLETLEEAEEEMDTEEETDTEDRSSKVEGEKEEEKADGGLDKELDKEQHSNGKDITNNEGAADFPVDLDDCITLDEVGEVQSSDNGEEDENVQKSRVVSILHLPSNYCKAKDFISLFKRHGKPVRCFIVNRLHRGFMEMSSHGEALRAVRKIRVFFKRQCSVFLSRKYPRLDSGWEIDDKLQPLIGSSRPRNQHGHKDESKRGRKESTVSSQEKKKSSQKTPVREDSNKKAQEKQSASKKTSEIESKSGKSQGIESKSRKTLASESKSGKCQKKQSSGRKENSSEGDKTQDMVSESRKTLDNELESGKSQKKLSSGRKEDSSEAVKNQDKVSESRKTLDNELQSGKSQKKLSSGRKGDSSEGEKTQEKVSDSRKTLDKDLESGKSHKKQSCGRKEDSTEGEKIQEEVPESQDTLDIDLESGKSQKKQSSGRKEDSSEREKTQDKVSEFRKTLDKELESGKSQKKQSSGRKEDSTEDEKIQDEVSKSKKTLDKELESGNSQKKKCSGRKEDSTEGEKIQDEVSKSKKTLDKDVESGKSQKKQSSGRKEDSSEGEKTQDKVSNDRKILDKELESGKSQKKQSSGRKEGSSEGVKTQEKVPESRKTLDKELESGNSQKKKSSGQKEDSSEGEKTQDKVSESRKTLDKELESGKSQKKQSSGRKEGSSEGVKTQEKVPESRKTLDKELESGNSQKKKSSSQKEDSLEGEKTQDKVSDDRKTLDKEFESGKSQKKQSSGQKEDSSEGEKTQDIVSESTKSMVSESEGEKSQKMKKDGVSSKDIKHPEGTDSSKHNQSRVGGPCEKRNAPLEDDSVPGKVRKGEQRSRTLGGSPKQRVQNSPEAQSDQKTADGPSGALTVPLLPVGTEFVRPVVGYFCNLCQLIYAEEDEAKVQHCSSRQHHDKYQEKMKTAS